jgi:pathogenesis-related protein 1
MKSELIAVFCIFSIPISHGHAAESIDTAAIVSEHNRLRTEAGVTEPLSYAPALAKSAQAWANHLQQSHHCQMQHSHAKEGYGENLYWASPLIWSNGRTELRTIAAAEVISSWGKEKIDYDHVSNTCALGAECGHYTQIIWRDTKKVGCGFAVCSDSREQVWVCHYSPAGNILGEKPY